MASQPCSQYFDLFNELIDLEALQDDLDEEISDSHTIVQNYDPASLLN